MRKMLPIALFFSLCFLYGSVFSQTHLSVPVNDRIYTILEIAGIRGLVSNLSAMQPYSNSSIRKYLTQILRQSKRLSPYERSIVQSIARHYTISPKPIRARIVQESAYRIALSDPGDYHTNNASILTLTGDLFDVMSGTGNFAICFDRVNKDAFAPYAFTKERIGFHMFGENGFVSEGEESIPVLGYSTRPELTLKLLNGTTTLRWARINRNWGIGHSSLLLSHQAQPIDALEGDIWFTPWAHVGFLYGSLGDWKKKDEEQKMLSLHCFEVYPFKGLYLSLWEAVVWGKRFEPSYINPFMIYFLAQNIIGDMDNIAIGGTIALTLSPFGQLYFAVFIDEIEAQNISKGLFTYPKHQFALQGGVKVSIPFIPLSLLTFQYTKIEPYCYTHYPQEYPFFTNTININFTHDGENIAYYLPPNSDEFFIKLQAIPTHFLHPYVQYQYIRHGTGDHTEGLIEGDIDIYLDYGSLSEYPDKNFLYDGIYEFIHILKLGCALEYHQIPFKVAFLPFEVKLTLEYAFVHATNYKNIEGMTYTDHLLYVGLELTALSIPLNFEQLRGKLFRDE